MSRRFVPPLAAALLSLLILAAPSSAQTFCVGAPTGCSGTTKPSVQAALDAAAGLAGRDRIQVGYDTTGPDGFTVAAGNAVDVVGVDAPTLWLDGDSPGVVIDEPSAIVGGFDVFVVGGAPVPAVDVAAGTLHDTSFEDAEVAPLIRLGTGTLDELSFPWVGPSGTAVRAVGPGGVITDSQIYGRVAVESTSDDLTIRRSVLQGDGQSSTSSSLRVTDGKVTVDDTGIYLGGDAVGTTAVDVAPGTGSAELALRSATVRGDGQPTLSTGVRASCTGGGTATVTLLDTAVFSFDTDLQRAAPGCAMSLDHVRYRTRDAGVGGTIVDGPGVTTGPVGPFGTWVHPGVDSPLIDAGSARTDTDTDLNNQPRVVDGNADGTAARDIGAAEYQRRPPHAVLEAQTANVNEPAMLWGDGSWDPDGGDDGRLNYTWTVDGAAVDPDDVDEYGSVLHTFTTLGTHTMSLTVTDPAGLSSTANANVTVTPLPVYDDDPGDGGATPFPPRPTTSVPGATVTVPGTPAVTLPPTTIKTPRVAINASLADLRLRSGRALRVIVTCRQLQTCRGSVVLRVGKTTLGRSGVFTIRSGGSRTVTVQVKAAGRRLLRRHPKGTTVRVVVLKTSGKSWTNGEGGRVTP